MDEAVQSAEKGDFLGGEKLCLRAIELARKEGGDSLRLAQSEIVLSNLYRAEKRLDLAEEAAKDAVTASEPGDTRKSVQLVPALENLAGFYFLVRERYDLALPLCQRVYDIVNSAPAWNSREVAKQASNLAGTYEKLGKYAEAEPFYLRAVTLSATSDEDLPKYLLISADFYRAWKKYKEAADIAERAVTLREKSPSSDQMDLAVALYKLAEIYLAWGKPERSEPLYTRCLLLTEKAAGAVSSAIVPPLFGRAQSLVAERQDREALSVYKQGLDIAYQTMNPELSQVAGWVDSYCSCLQRLQRSDEVQQIRQIYEWKKSMYSSVQALKKNQREESLRFCQRAENLAASLSHQTYLSSSETFEAEIYRAEGKMVLAEQTYLQAVDDCAKVVGSTNSAMIAPLEALANFYTFTQVRLNEVARLDRRILDIVKEVPSPDGAEVARRSRNLGDVYMALKDVKNAEQSYLVSLASAEKSASENASDRSQYLSVLADFYRTTGRFDEAESFGLRFLSLREKTAAANPVPDAQLDLAVCLDGLSHTFLDANKAESAEMDDRRSIAIVEKLGGMESVELVPRLSHLAEALRAQQKLSAAQSVYQRALAIAEKQWSRNTPEFQEVYQRYAELLKAMNKSALPLGRIGIEVSADLAQATAQR